VVNNTIRNSYKPLISIAQLNLPDYDASGSIVHGNICQRTRSSHGITLTGYGCKDLSITNNIIVEAEEGIAVSGNTHNILISNNIIRSCRKSGIRVNGVKGYNTKYIKISNNMCYNNGTRKDIREIHRAGIRLSADEVGTLHNCVIENNSCFDDRQLKKTQDFGIILMNTKDCVVKNNDTRNNIVAGISESGNTDMVSSENIA
jgi:hypothetical protein